MRITLARLVVATALAVLGFVPTPVAVAAPGQDGGGCIPFVGCGSFDGGTGRGCIEGIGCAEGDLGNLSGCANGVCGTWRP